MPQEHILAGAAAEVRSRSALHLLNEFQEINSQFVPG